ncbi:Exocyst complex component S5 [Mycoemilia scoparia]|uniref:Exocyst complex component SEC5 n=1 Tax=Mycoemilia scoparia TaxID=417184 RepID=A0A9W8DNG7_9FUNG|nr:Exocyst complex component S5 [Mycoemilia scoparia]
MRIEDTEVLRYYNTESYKARVWNQVDGSQDNDSGQGGNVDRTADGNSNQASKDHTAEEGDSDSDSDDEDSHGKKANTNEYSVNVLTDIDPLNIKSSIKETLEQTGRSAMTSDMNELAKLSILHRNFAPAQFLDIIHDSTTYPDLILGHTHLYEGSSKRTEALKTLVKNNFDSFVEAKSRIDMLYEGMKSSELSEAHGYGTKPFISALDDVSSYANQVYGPIMDQRMKAEKIQSTLSIIERYKFFFNLPHSLIEYTKQEKFDIAVREFKKGCKLLASVSSSTSRDFSSQAGGSAALKNLFDMVWKEVKESVVQLREALYDRLTQSWCPFDEQEKCIRHLFDIHPGDKNPVAFYIEHQYRWTLSQLDEQKNRYTKKLASMNSASSKHYNRLLGIDENSKEAQEIKRRAEAIKRASELEHTLEIQSSDAPPSVLQIKDKSYSHWRIIQNTINSLSSIITRCFPDFCKVSRAYIEERYQSVPNIDSRRGNRQRTGASDRSKFCFNLMEDIVCSYGQHINSILFNENESDADLTKGHVSLAVIEELVSNITNYLPRTHCAVAGFFSTSLMETITNSVNEMVKLDISPQTYRLFDNLVTQLKAKMIFVLCRYWKEDSSILHLHEDWKIFYGSNDWPALPYPYSSKGPQGPGMALEEDLGSDGFSGLTNYIASTRLLTTFLKAEKTVIEQLSTISGTMVNKPSGDSMASMPQMPSTSNSMQEGSSRLMELANYQMNLSLYDSICAFLDSLHMLAFVSEDSPGDQESSGSRAKTHHDEMQPAFNNKNANPWVGISGADSQSKTKYMLFTMCNITALKLVALPGLLQFRTLRRLLKNDELATSARRLGDIVASLDDVVFHSYIHKKSSQLTGIIRQGVLVGGYSWATSEYPKSTQPYISEALLFLVFVHAEIMDVMTEGAGASQLTRIQQQPLIKRIFEILVADMAQEMLDSFRMVDGFGEGGILQALLETMVIGQTLSQYKTRSSEECTKLLYSYLDATYKRTSARAEKTASSADDGRRTELRNSANTTNVHGVDLTKQQWAILQNLVKESTRRTSIQFRCFQSPETQ